jgi:hypothetical protein
VCIDGCQELALTSIENFITNGIPMAKAYREERSLLGVRERPRYNIDPTLPEAILKIQAEFDIKREARHLCSTLYDDAEIEIHRNVAGCCTFNNCKHITDGISHQRKKERINDLDDATLEEGSWVTERIATLAGVSRHGRPLVDFDWAFANSIHGYDKSPLKEIVRAEVELRRKPSPELSPPSDTGYKSESGSLRLSASPETAAYLQAIEDKKQLTSMPTTESGKSQQGVGGQSSLKRAANQLSRDQISDILSRPDLGLSLSRPTSPSSSNLNPQTTSGPSNTKLPEVTSPEVSRTQQPAPALPSVRSTTAALADGLCKCCHIFNMECDRTLPNCKQCVDTGRNCKWWTGSGYELWRTL